MGKLIVFEGTDGSGKSTQFQLLTEKMQKNQMDFQRLVFPQYSEPSSSLIRMYLNGEFGTNPADVNAYAASCFYAVDRFASYQKVWKPYYEAGGLVLADRYTTSNAVHQGAKVPEAERDAFFSWLYEFEFQKMGLPKPDLVLFLDVPIEITEQMMRRRERATNTSADIHEQDLDYLRCCRKTGLEAAAFYGWTVVNCAEADGMRPIAQIHEEIYEYVKVCLED